jgi:peptidoglycan/xylan/chitin deacetylase (PgdA/CDA1 family)
MISSPITHIIHRSIPTKANEIFFTFDDGPDSLGTPKVLDLLKKFNAKASFFVIGQKIEPNKEIFNRILNEGHGVFCHSIDHNYWHYFCTKNHIKEWITKSLFQLNEFSGTVSPKFFRPPAGVITPPLLAAASELNIKLILWNHRFYDKTCAMTIKKYQKALRTIQKGHIVLLHDAQMQKNLDIFLKTLEWFLCELDRKQFIFSKLPSVLPTTEDLDV